MAATIGNGIALGNPFDVNANVPPDSRQTQPNIASRNAIVWKYDGLKCYVESEKIEYVFVLGHASGSLLDNNNWTTNTITEPDIVAPGTYTKVQVNSKGRVVVGDTINTLDVGGLIDIGTGRINQSLMPALSIIDTFVRNSEAAMLALDAQQGDICVRTDLNKSFILTDDDPTQVGNWQELLSTSGTVTSVSLSMPSPEFNVTNPTITSAGTFGVTWKNQGQSTVLAGPQSSAGMPSFRLLGIGDITSLASELGNINTTLSGKANLVGGNNFYGDQYFTDSILAYSATINSTVYIKGNYGPFSDNTHIAFRNNPIDPDDGSVTWLRTQNHSNGDVYLTLPITDGELALTSQLPSNYVTTNTSQSGLTGAKGWNSQHTFNVSGSPGISLVNNTQLNFSTAGGTYSGYLRGDGIQLTGGSYQIDFQNSRINFNYNSGAFYTSLEGSNVGAINTVKLPTGSGTLALVSQIPDISSKQDVISTTGYAYFNGTSLVAVNASASNFVRGNGTTADFNGGVRGVILTGLSANNSAILASDNVLTAFGKSQGQLNSKAAIDGSNASGTWGVNISGNAQYLQGYQATVSATYNAIVRRDENGYINATYLNMSAPQIDATDFTDIVTTLSDGYLRRNSISALKIKLGLPTNGAYDLQWVTDNGVTTDNDIIILKEAEDYLVAYSHKGIQASNYAYSSVKNLLLQYSGGNVGIGTTNPTSKLHVAGDIYASSQIFSTGLILANKTGGDGSAWGDAQLELRGKNPGIGFHYPGQYGAALYMNISGTLTWGANGFNATSWLYTDGFVQGQRIVAGYDSGVAGSINTSDYLRVSGNGGVWWPGREIGISVSTDDDLLHISKNSNNVGIWFDTNAGKKAGIYADNNNWIGFINTSGDWSLRVDNSGNAVFSGYVTATGGAGTSDIRHKDLVSGFKHKDLTWLDEDRTFAFKWRDYTLDQGRLHYGYSAQDIDNFAPELVFKNDKDKYSLNQTELLILEVKRLKQRVAELEHNQRI